MMSRIISIMSGLVLCFCLSPVQAQQLKSALEKLQKTYEGKENLNVKMQIRAYETEASTQAFYEHTVEVKKQGDKYFYVYPGNEMLLADGLLLLIDKQRKMISCQPRNPEDQENLPKNPLQNLDTLMGQYNKETYLGKKQGYDHYRLEHEQSMIQTTELLLNPESGLVHQMVYHYRSGQYVSIDFVTFDLDPSFDQQTFATTRYIRGEEPQSWQPAPAYQDYQLIR